MESKTKKSTRIIMWVIAIVMAGGFIGSYFLVIIQNGNQQQDEQELAQQQVTNEAQKNQEVDPTAYKVEGKVNDLQVTDLQVGTGDAVKEGDSVQVHYKGTIAQTGVKFDSSYDRGEPITFGLSQVIEGWQKGMVGMQVGGKRRLVIPAAQAYGDTAQPGIPANSDLVFEVELFAVNPPQDPSSAQ